MIIQDDDFLLEEHKQFINDTLLSDNFPFFYNEWKNLSYMGHNVVLRNGLRNSDYYEDFMSMLYAFTTKHDIQVNRILRCSLNMTFPLFEGTSPIHKDHEEEHKLQNQDKIEIGTNARKLDFTPNNKQTRDSIN